MTTSNITLSTIDTHENKEACVEWMRNNMHDLGEHVTQEAIESLNALCLELGVHVDYSISLIGDRGEFINFSRVHGTNESHGLLDKHLNGDCPFTGMAYDENLIDAFRDSDDNELLIDVLDLAAGNLLEAIHTEGEYIYSDKGLEERAQENEYTFLPCGKMYNLK